MTQPRATVGASRGLPPDYEIRRRAIEDRARGAIVQAGAGSGKTSTLVDRVLGLLEDSDVPSSSIAVITFTERAAEEVTERLLAAGADVATAPGGSPGNGLTVTTLHGFAASLVRSFPVESGIPLQLEILDEAEAETDRLVRLRARLAEPSTLSELAPILEVADALGVDARRLTGNPDQHRLRPLEASWRWAVEHLDRVEDVGFEPVELPDAVAAAHAVLQVLPPDEVAEWSRSAPAHDRLAARLVALAPALDRLARDVPPLDGRRPSTPSVDADPASPWTCGSRIPDCQRHAIAALARLELLSDASRLGNASNWSSRARLAEVRDRVTEAARLRRSVLATWQQAIGQELARLAASWAASDAALRWQTGRASFADLLLGARRLLRSSPPTRAALRRRWQRLLIDEFQDTDPIQLELACLLASSIEPDELARRLGAKAPDEEPPVPVEAGRLFVVGDPLQSIYRFRRADPELFLRATSRLTEPAGALPQLRLQANFRTVPEILDWVDELVRHLTRGLPDLEPGTSAGTAGTPTGPARPAPLLPTRRAPDSGPGAARPSRLVGVVAEGVETAFASTADAAAAQAEAFGQVLSSIRQHPERWLVEERTPSGAPAWRPARVGDVALLVPNRTHLRTFLDVLDELEIPARAGGGIPLDALTTFRTLSAIVHALAEPSDRLSTAEALRCGPFDVPSSLLAACLDWLEAPEETREAVGWEGPGTPLGPTAEAPIEKALRTMTMLRAAVVDLDARRALDLAASLFGLPGPEHATGELRLVWAWAERLAAEGRGLKDLSTLLRESSAHDVRAPEDPLAEASEAVSVLTIHAAKGLEFPIVIVAGLDTMTRSGQDAVLADPETKRPLARPIPGPIDLGDDDRFHQASEAEGRAEAGERGRLAYVACTRARDHLVLLLHRKAPAARTKRAPTVAELMAETCRADPARWQTLDRAITERALDEPARAAVLDLGPGRPEEPAESSVDRWLAVAAMDDRPGDWPWAWLEGRARTAAHDEEHLRQRPFARASDLDQASPTPRPTGGSTPTFETPEASGRAGAQRLGIAVHQVLERGFDPSTGAARQSIARAAQRAGVDPALLQALVESASTSEAVGRARRASRAWRELPVSAVVDGHHLEARLDLAWEALGEDEDGTGLAAGGAAPQALELADYKTTAALLHEGEEPPERLVERYRLQLGAYAEALERATGRPVRRAWVVRCHPDGVAEACLEGTTLADARADAARAIRALARPLGSRGEPRPG